MKSPIKSIQIVFIFLTLPLTQVNANNVFNTSKAVEGNFYVVLTGKPSFDSSLKKAVSDYRQVTKTYKFINDKQVKEFDKNKNNLILMAKSSYFNNSGVGRISSGLYLFKGKTKYIIDAIAVSSFDAYGLEGNAEKAFYRLGFMIKDLNDQILIRGNNVQNKGKLLTQKVLLVKEEYFLSEKKHPAVIEKGAFQTYGWKYEIMPEEKIRELIEKKDGRYALFCTVVTDGVAMVNIYDLGTAEIIFRYYNRGNYFSLSLGKRKTN